MYNNDFRDPIFIENAELRPIIAIPLSEHTPGYSSVDSGCEIIYRDSARGPSVWLSRQPAGKVYVLRKISKSSHAIIAGLLAVKTHCQP